ncbi:hypothetical protein AAZV13_19G013500 [Glycine max]
MTTISYWRSSPSLHFYIVFLVEEHTKAVILISKLSECREGERTLKLHFLSPKSFDLLSQTDLISLFLYLRFLCFFVSHNTKAYIFLVNLFACREGGRAHYNCIFYLKTPGRRWKKKLKL